MLIPIPLFTRPTDLLNFIEGKGSEKDLYGMLTGFLGPEENELLFVPVEIPAKGNALTLARSFTTSASNLHHRSRRTGGPLSGSNRICHQLSRAVGTSTTQQRTDARDWASSTYYRMN